MPPQKKCFIILLYSTKIVHEILWKAKLLNKIISNYGGVVSEISVEELGKNKT